MGGTAKQEGQKRYRESHMLAFRRYNRAYAKTHPEKIREYQKAYAAAHTSEQKAYQEVYRLVNAEKVNAAKRAWAKAHRAERKAYKEARRARLKGSSVGDVKAVASFYKKVRTASRMRCYWCKKWTSKAERHVDHIFPISKGGAHAAGNLCCSCVRCNLSKRAKRPEEFSGQFELALV